MIIGGLKKVSLIDYPSEVSCVIFTRGCNMRCIYCHNSHLVLPELYGETLPEADIFSYLESRKDRLSAVVISGGEPTIHPDLPEFIGRVKDTGYKVKLDTNGTNPTMIKNLLEQNLIDYIAMDIKAIPEKYNSICGVKVDTECIAESIELIQNSSIKKEFRITLLNGMHTAEDVAAIRSMIKGDLTLQMYKHVDSVISKELDGGYELAGNLLG